MDGTTVAVIGAVVGAALLVLGTRMRLRAGAASRLLERRPRGRGAKGEAQKVRTGPSPAQETQGAPRRTPTAGRDA